MVDFSLRDAIRWPRQIWPWGPSGDGRHLLPAVAVMWRCSQRLLLRVSDKMSFRPRVFPVGQWA